MSRPLVVTGCGRSGTKYTGEVLGRLGLAIGHEQVFEPPVARFAGFGGRQGDSSWAAVPFLGEVPPDTVVAHQVRHPLAVIRSFRDIGFFTVRPGPSLVEDVWRRARRRRGSNLAFQRLVLRHCPAVYEEADELARGARYWLEWNRLTETEARRAGLDYERHRLEDLDGEVIAGLLVRAGLEPTRPIAEVLAGVPTDTNRKQRFDEIGWDDLPAELGGAVRALASDYGYR